MSEQEKVAAEQHELAEAENAPAESRAELIEAPSAPGAAHAAPTAPRQPPAGASGEPAATPHAPDPKRRALRAGAAAAAAVLLGVGIGVGVINTQYPQARATAPTTAPLRTAAPSAAPAYGAQSNGTHFGAIRDLLLPVPAGFALGPDDGVYGNDTELTKAQIDGYLDDRVAGLPKDQRDKVKAALQAQGHRAAGVRSYRSSDGGVVATVWLDQFDKQAVDAQNAFDAAMGSDSGLFRQGPAVPGYQQAACFLPPLRPGNPIDDMDCTAGVGDLLVTMHVEGVAPLPKSEAVSIFRQQLLRLAVPGASV